MANKNLFKSSSSIQAVEATDTINKASAPAYSNEPKHHLAQLACTGTMHNVYYSSAEDQLDEVKNLLPDVDPEFIAKLAVYSRNSAYMKDMPALLVAYLASGNDNDLAEKVWDRVIDNGRMIRNFVQIIRSGTFGRKSFGQKFKRLINKWLNDVPDHVLFKASIGNDPSIADVIKLTHPRPVSISRDALFGYMIGKKVDIDRLPGVVRDWELFKSGVSSKIPNVDFRMLSSLDIGKDAWRSIAENAPWMMTRMNLNTFNRHGVFDDADMIKMIADRLSNRDLIKRARAFPYQLMVAYASSIGVPMAVRESLQDAMEIATENVPRIDGSVVVCVDTSGSMSWTSLFGSRSVVKPIDVAGLVAASIVRTNKSARVIGFAERATEIELNPRDSVMTNASKLASLGGGGTDVSSALSLINSKEMDVDTVIYVSDNQSWLDAKYCSPTQTMNEFAKLKKRNYKAKMIMIDVQPYGDTQVKERKDILNIGGFSDQIFNVITDFVNGGTDAGHWVKVINDINL